MHVSAHNPRLFMVPKLKGSQLLSPGDMFTLTGVIFHGQTTMKQITTTVCPYINWTNAFARAKRHSASTILSIDLSHDWTNASVTIRSTAKPSGVPSLNKPSLWYNRADDLIYTGYTGVPSLVATNRPIPPSSLWAFTPDDTGSGSWSQVIGSDDPIWSSTKKSVHGLMAYGPDNAFVLGGNDPFNNVLKPGLVIYSFRNRVKFECVGV